MIQTHINAVHWFIQGHLFVPLTNTWILTITTMYKCWISSLLLDFENFRTELSGTKRSRKFSFNDVAQRDEQLAFFSVFCMQYDYWVWHTRYSILLKYSVSHILTSCWVSFQKPEGKAELFFFDMQRKHFRHHLTEWAAVWDHGVIESYSLHVHTLPIPYDLLHAALVYVRPIMNIFLLFYFWYV